MDIGNTRDQCHNMHNRALVPICFLLKVHFLTKIGAIYNFMGFIALVVQKRLSIWALIVLMRALASKAFKGRASSKIVLGLPPSYSVHLVDNFGALFVINIVLQIDFLVFFSFHFFVLMFYHFFSHKLIYWYNFGLGR